VVAFALLAGVLAAAPLVPQLATAKFDSARQECFWPPNSQCPSVIQRADEGVISFHGLQTDPAVGRCKADTDREPALPPSLDIDHR
jgi:hypothetical protein